VRVACVLRHSNELNECSIERPLFRLRVWVCFVCLGGVDLDIKLGLITPKNTQNTQKLDNVLQVRMLYVGRLQTAHGTRVTHMQVWTVS
jgi:hypothetical protein